VTRSLMMRNPRPDAAGFRAVAETLVAGRISMADPAVPALELIVLLLSHLSTMQALLDDATARGAIGISLSAHCASSRRLRRMLQLCARTSAGGRRGQLDAGTLRASIAQQLNSHLEIERELLASIDAFLSPAEVRALNGRYRRLMVAAVADPRWAVIFGRGRTVGSGQAARLRAARLASRRGRCDEAAAPEGPP
jgi:hypothetical protein